MYSNTILYNFIISIDMQLETPGVRMRHHAARHADSMIHHVASRHDTPCSIRHHDQCVARVWSILAIWHETLIFPRFYKAWDIETRCMRHAALDLHETRYTRAAWDTLYYILELHDSCSAWDTLRETRCMRHATLDLHETRCMRHAALDLHETRCMRHAAWDTLH